MTDENEPPPGARDIARGMLDIQRRVEDAMRLVTQNREAILTAFLAEHGCLPSECEQVQVTEGTTIRWFVRKREDA